MLQVYSVRLPAQQNCKHVDPTTKAKLTQVQGRKGEEVGENVSTDLPYFDRFATENYNRRHFFPNSVALRDRKQA